MLYDYYLFNLKWKWVFDPEGKEQFVARDDVNALIQYYNTFLAMSSFKNYLPRTVVFCSPSLASSTTTTTSIASFIDIVLNLLSDS